MPLKYGLIEPADIYLPRLPAPLEGLRVAHVSDLHRHGADRRDRRLINQLAPMRLDLVFFTGDYMTLGRGEEPGLELLGRLARAVRPSLGCFGVFGNHDSLAFRQQARELPIHWLENTGHTFTDHPLTLAGLDTHPKPDGGTDPLAFALGLPEAFAPDDAALPMDQRRLRLVLSHYPNQIAVASDVGADLVFSGHSHGGQMRLPSGQAFANSSDLPLHLTSGLLRHRQTLCVVSRGLGEVRAPLRLFCPAHCPVYTLRRRSMQGRPTDDIECLWKW